MQPQLSFPGRLGFYFFSLAELTERAEKEICRINKNFDFFSVFSVGSVRDMFLVAVLSHCYLCGKGL